MYNVENVFPAALAANVTVDEGGLSGIPNGSYLAIYPQGGTAGSSFMNFGPGQILANAGVFSINQSTGFFTVYASAKARVIIDVYGVFVEPAATQLDCVATAKNINTLPASTQSYTSAPACPSGYSTVGVRCYTIDAETELTGSGLINNDPTQVMFCSWNHYGTLTSGNLETSAQCCRVPGA